MTLFSLGFAVCELRKALIYKGMWRAGKTPKAGVAGSIPAGRTNCDRGSRESSCFRSPERHLNSADLPMYRAGRASYATPSASRAACHSHAFARRRRLR
jgi:hypothetical protein